VISFLSPLIKIFLQLTGEETLEQGYHKIEEQDVKKL
jgi:hypothetical protein